MSIALLPQELAIVIDSEINTADIHIFGLSRRDLEVECLERAQLGENLQNGGQYARADAWPAISLAPLFVVLRARKAIEELLFVQIRSVSYYFCIAVEQGDSCHLRDHFADCTAKSSKPQIFVVDHIAQRNVIRLLKCAFQQRFRNFKPDEI